MVWGAWEYIVFHASKFASVNQFVKRCALGTTDIGGVPVEFRAYDNNEALKMLVGVLPEQKVAIVRILFITVSILPLAWIASIGSIHCKHCGMTPFETLLVGHGLPTTRAELTTAIEYLKTMDRIWNDAETADDFVSGMKAACPGYTGEFAEPREKIGTNRLIAFGRAFGSPRRF